MSETSIQQKYESLRESVAALKREFDSYGHHWAVYGAERCGEILECHEPPAAPAAAEPRRLADLPRCPKCKSADITACGHELWKYECRACGNKMTEMPPPIRDLQNNALAAPAAAEPQLPTPTLDANDDLAWLVNGIRQQANDFLTKATPYERGIALTTLRAHALVLREDFDATGEPSPATKPDEPRGTFRCDLCERETPHHHELSDSFAQRTDSRISN